MKDIDPTDEKQIEERAVHLLSRREHSYLELKRKLVQKGFAGSSIESVLNVLENRGWQSDTRFTESFVRQRVMQRRGPIKIKTDLQQRGIDAQKTENALAAEEVNWKQIAVETLTKKFKNPAAGDLKMLAKRQRFLASRGFTPDHIRYAIDVTESEDWDWEQPIF